MNQFFSFLTLLSILFNLNTATAFADSKSKAIISVPQSVSVKGSWRCFVTPSSGGFTSEDYTFTQTGNRFVSSGDETSHKIYGTIQGTSIQISRVVNGEFLEGFVMYGEGHVISINGGSNNGIITVYHNSQAGVGSFNCNKQ